MMRDDYRACARFFCHNRIVHTENAFDNKGRPLCRFYIFGKLVRAHRPHLFAKHIVIGSVSAVSVIDVHTDADRPEGKCLRDLMIYLGRIGIRFDNADGVRTFLINCGDFFIAAHSPPIQCAGFMEAACKLHTAIVLKMGKCGAHNRCAVMMAEKIKSRICQI